MDVKLDRRDLMTEQKMQTAANATQEQRKQNKILDAALEMQERNRELQESRYSWWGLITWKDSEEMTQVKEANQALVDFMSRAMDTADEQTFESQLTELTGLYEQVVEKCKNYLDVHKKTPKFESGRVRKRLVKQQMDDAKRDLKLLRQKAYEIYRMIVGFDYDQVPWVNVLGAIRTVKVDVAQNTTKKTEGATSDVTVLEIKKKKYFYKEDETLKSPMDEFDSRILGKGKTKADNALIQKVKELLTTEDFQTSAIILNEESIQKLKSRNSADWAKGVKLIKDGLQSLGEADKLALLKWDDPKVISLLHEILPQYAKWKTRYDVAKDAKIDDGRLLTDRNIATSRLAKLMGFENLVVSSQKVLTEENKSGVVTKESRGVSMKELSKAGKNNVIYTPEAARKLTMLQLFDVLCGQIDRNGSNIFYVAEKIEIRGQKPVYRVTDVQGIDNDMSFGKLSWADVTADEKGLLKLVAPEYDGKCQLPVIDQDMAAAIDALEIEQVKLLLCDLLNEEELSALESRLEGLKEMIHNNPELVKPKEEWDAKTMEKFGINSAQPGNAYCRLEKKKMEHNYAGDNADYDVFCKTKDKLVGDLEKQTTMAGKARFFISHYGNMAIAKKNKYKDMLDIILYDELVKVMSTKFLDALVKERSRLVQKVIETYQQYYNDGVPEHLLIKPEEKENPEAKAEYARSKLLILEDLKAVHHFDNMMPFFIMLPAFEENGKKIQPGPYFTDALKKESQKPVGDLSHQDVEKLFTRLTTDTPEKYKYIHKNIIEGNLRLKKDEANYDSEKLMESYFGELANIEEPRKNDDDDEEDQGE